MPMTVKQQIKEGKDALLDIQREHLSDIADAMITQVMSRARRATPAQKLGAIKDVATPGTSAYKALLTTALVVISSEALQAARKEVPKAKNVQLADEWAIEDLPSALRKKILAEVNLLVGTQISDLEKHIFFQFQSSVGSTDSDDTIEADLVTAAEDYIRGPGIAAGAAVQAAKYVNTARSAFFYDSETLDQIDAFEFVNADPVSPICQDLAGTIFSKDDPNADRYQPPLHWNCKSWIRPILKGNLPATKEIEALKPSTRKLEDTIQFSDPEDGCIRCGGAGSGGAREGAGRKPGHHMTSKASNGQIKMKTPSTPEEAKALLDEIEHHVADAKAAYEADKSFDNGMKMDHANRQMTKALSMVKSFLVTEKKS